jgi:hypothetical protein
MGAKTQITGIKGVALGLPSIGISFALFVSPPIQRALKLVNTSKRER